MKIRYLAAMIAALSISTTSLAAGSGEAVFKQSNCNGCHAIDRKSVGPALKDVAAKYAGDKDAQAKLEKKTRNGGSGTFGVMPMPVTPKTVSDADIKTMVTWILSLK